MKLEHSAVNVKDAGTVAAWWSEHLGLRIVLAQDEPPYMHFLADADGSMMEIYTMEDVEIPDWATIDPRSIHFAFKVDDIEAEGKRLKAAGAEIVLANTAPSGDKLMFLRDPYHTPFQLVQRVKPLL